MRKCPDVSVRTNKQMFCYCYYFIITTVIVSIGAAFAN